MTTVSRNFFTYARDESEYWQELPAHATKAYGLYLIMEGERTHCCSLSASSWAINLQNVFSCPISDADKLHSVLDNDGDWEYFEGLEDCYFNFVNWNESRRDCSELVEISVETDEEIIEGEPLPESVHDEIWEAAREYFGGNQYLPAICDYEPETTESENV